MADMRHVDEFIEQWAAAMRVGEPGACDGVPYHVLEGDAVEALRESSAAGGLAYCERCGKGIFVPGYPDAGIPVYGLPGGVNMKGVRL